MGQSSTKAAAQTAARSVKYPPSAGAAASAASAAPPTPTPHAHATPQAATGVPRAPPSSFAAQLSKLKTQQERSFDEHDVPPAAADEFDPSQQQDTISSERKRALRELIGNNSQRTSKIDAKRVNFSMNATAAADEQPTPSPSASSAAAAEAAEADRMVHRFAPGGVHTVVDPAAEQVRVHASAPTASTSQADAASAQMLRQPAPIEIESAAAAAKRTASRFPLMDAQERVKAEMALKDTVLDSRLSALSSNIVTVGAGAGAASASEAPAVQSEKPKYGWHPNAASAASRRPLPQRQAAAVAAAENPERMRVPAGKLNTVMLLQLMVTQKEKRSTWDIKALSARFQVPEATVERMLTSFTLPWLWYDGKKLGAYKQQPAASNAVLLGEELLENKSHHKLYKKSRQDAAGLGGAF